MNITLFGANGKVGSIILQKLLSEGHSVNAFVYGSSADPKNPKLKIINGNVYEYQSVQEAIEGADVVVSALGSWGTKNKDILTEGMKNIIPAMSQHKVSRIISLTGHDARWSKDTNGLLNIITHPLLKVVAPKILRDGEKHIELLQNSNLKWTVVRSPVMNESGLDEFSFTVKRPSPWTTIKRSAVAAAMVSLINNEEFLYCSPFIIRR